MTRERVGAVRDRLARLGGGAWGRGFAESSAAIPRQLRARRRPSSPTARAARRGVLRSLPKIPLRGPRASLSLARPGPAPSGVYGPLLCSLVCSYHSVPSHPPAGVRVLGPAL